MGPAEITRFLTSLAVKEKVAASTQNQALSALLFLYRKVLEQDLPWIDGVVRAKRPERPPVVLTSRPQQCPAAPGRDRLTGFRRPYATAPRPGTGAMTATYATHDTRTFPEYADRAGQRLQNSAVRPNSSSATIR